MSIMDELNFCQERLKLMSEVFQKSEVGTVFYHNSPFGWFISVKINNGEVFVVEETDYVLGRDLVGGYLNLVKHNKFFIDIYSVPNWIQKLYEVEYD